MPDYFGFGALTSIILFLWSLLSIKNLSRAQAVNKGFMFGLWWGVLVYFAQLYWVWSVLYHFSQRLFVFKLAAYCLLSSYFVWTSACWVGSMMFIGWHAQRVFFRLMIYVLFTISYFIWLGNIGVLILASGDGYPLLNPLIPLCTYRWFVQLVCLVSSLVVGPNHFYDPLPTSCVMVSLKPLVNQHNKYRANASSLGQQIYHQLCDVRSLLKNHNKDQKVICCGAESFFPFELNKYPELVALWGSAIPDDASLLIGAHCQYGEKVHQAAFLIQQRRIKKIYVKKHLVPFIEYIPYTWSALPINARLLSEQQEMFVRGRNKFHNRFFTCASGDYRVLPQICSEFIFAHTTRCFRRCISKKRSTCVMWLVNDSWFIGPFKQILLLAGCLRGSWIGLPVISISHELMSNKCGVNRLGF